MAGKKKASGVARIDPSLQIEIEKLLNKGDNRIYCDSVSSFIKIAVKELLDKIKENDNKIKWEKK